ncbi:MAG: hypothetical protein Ct9H300mP28_30440 [Pseudomonadota bacterium]|nr:MAG: hypothetical protein Ct9H300mP28_30440 [Pseudomonadota bacterium]
MQAEILGESEETVHGMQEESTLYPDPNDRASLETEHINNLRIRDRERKLLTKVEEALDALKIKHLDIAKLGKEIGGSDCDSTCDNILHNMKESWKLQRIKSNLI